jgi:peptide chain release factor 1
MHSKLEQLARRLEEIDRGLASEEAARDMNRFRALGRER